jgi:hypothetical protein
VLIAGLATMVASMLWLSAVSPSGSYFADVFGGLTLSGLGLGLTFVAVTMGATRGVHVHDQGLASGLLNTAQQVGLAVGLAALAAVASGVTAAASGSEAERLSSGYAAGFLAAAVVGTLGAVLGLLLMRGGVAAANPPERPVSARPPRA